MASFANVNLGAEGSTDSEIRVRRIDSDTDAAAWDAFVAASPDSSLYHRYGWRRIIHKSFGHETFYLTAELEGNVVGVLPLVFMRRRFEVPPGGTLHVEGLPAVLMAFPYGQGLEAEAFFVRLGFSPLPGDPVVDRRGRLVAIGHGPSVQEGGGVGLAVPWGYANDFLVAVLGWPAASAPATE